MSFDPDFGKTGFARKLLRLRFRRLGISQKAFAARYGLPYSTVRDLEQSRHRPTGALRVLIEAIRLDPDLIALAARNAKDDPDCANFVDTQ